MSLDLAKLTQDMCTAAKGVLAEKGPGIMKYAEPEFKKILENVAKIEKMQLEGNITEKKAQLMLKMQVNSAKIVLLTVEGMSKLLVEQIINAALGAIKGPVNSALGINIF